LVEIDLDSMLHAPKSGDGSMSCVEGEEWQTFEVGVLDLRGKR
jgi:hypothetical protein